jgi:hypothetical protein
MNTLTDGNETALEMVDTAITDGKETISKIELLVSLLIFAMAWAMMFESAHFIDRKLQARLVRLVSFQGQIYMITGKVRHKYFKAIPFGDTKEMLIPIKEIHRVANIDNKDC